MIATTEKHKDLFGLTLKISEIFHSIQGESTMAGLPCVFVRLQGCNMRCEWCDTDYALDAKIKTGLMTFEEIIQKVKSFDCGFIEFTGGEPMMQPNSTKLMEYFCGEGFTVALETNGSYDLAPVDFRVIIIMDIKCPSSKMEKHNYYKNFNLLKINDNVKFVIADRTDYDFAKKICSEYNLYAHPAEIIFSPAFGSLQAVKLAEWILDDKLKVRMQLQMHKYIWEPDRRGV